jgi:hypothetical protein
MFRLLKPPRARLAAAMMMVMMMPAQIHDQKTIVKTPDPVKRPCRNRKALRVAASRKKPVPSE